MAQDSARKSLRRRLVVTSVLAVLAVISTLLLLGHISNMNELHQRELASAAREVRKTVENAIRTVRELKLSTGKRVCQFDKDQPYLDYVGPGDCSEAQGDFSRAKAESGKSGVEIKAGEYTFRFRVDTLLQEVPFPQSFHLVFLANDKGQVLYQEAQETSRWLRQLREGERMFRENANSDTGPLRLKDLSEILASEKPNFATLKASSSRTRISLAGRLHEVYLHPVTLENGDAVEFVLGGIVPTQEIFWQTLSIDTYFSAGVSLILVAAALGYPFAKLFLLDRHERFRIRDVYLLHWCTAVLLTLFSLAILAVDARVRYDTIADHGMESYATQLEGKLLAELIRTRDRLVEYEKSLGSLPQRPCDKWTLQENWLEARNGILPLSNDVDLEQAAWVKEDGKQVWKATSDRIASKTSVAHRDYFKSVQRGNLYKIEDQPGPDFYWSPSRSITDGRFYTFLSMKSSLPQGYCSEIPKDRLVTVATVNLSSLHRQALPPGYRFAVLNREGDVLYHSDDRLSLRENLYAEVSRPDSLKAVVFSGREASIPLRYRDRACQFHLLPLKRLVRAEPQKGQTGLYIAVFRDLTFERAAVINVLSSSLLGALPVVCLAAGVAMLLMAWVSERKYGTRGAILWPHHSPRVDYQKLIVVMAGVLALVMVLDSDLLYLFVPVLGSVCALEIYLTQRRLKTKHKDEEWPHITALILLLCCVAIAPVSRYFFDAMEAEFGTLIQAGRQSIQEQKEDVFLDARAKKLMDGFDASLGDRVAKMGLAYASNPPSPFDREPQRIPERRNLAAKLHDWLGNKLPVESEAAVFLRHRESGASYPFGTGLSPVFPRISLGGTLAFAALITLLAMWIRWTRNTLFLAQFAAVREDPRAAAGQRAEEPEQVQQERWDKCSEDQRNLLIQVAQENAFNRHQRMEVESLIRNGLLRLAPDIKPVTREFELFLEKKAKEQPEVLQQWEQPAENSWRNRRPLLIAMGLVLFLFIAATQPWLQTLVIGSVTALATLVSTLDKLLGTVSSWNSNKKPGA